MQVLPSGFQSIESMALMGLLALGVLSGSLFLAGFALALIALLRKSERRKPDEDFAF